MKTKTKNTDTAKQTKPSFIKNLKSNKLLKYIFLFFLVFVSTLILIYIVQPKTISFDGARGIRKHNIRVTVGGQPVNLSDGKLVLDGNMKDKEIVVQEDNYKPKVFSLHSRRDFCTSQTIGLVPVDYSKLYVRMSLDKKIIGKNISLNYDSIRLDEQPIVGSKNGEDFAEFVSTEIQKKKIEIDIVDPNFTPVHKSLDLSFGLQQIDLELEYNVQKKLTVKDLTTNKGLSEVIIGETGKKTDANGVAQIEHIELLGDFQLKKDGYFDQKINLNLSRDTFSLLPIGRIVFPKFEENSEQKPISPLTLFSANFDGSDEKIVDRNVKNIGLNQNGLVNYIVGDIGTGTTYDIKQLNVNTNEVVKIDSFRNSEFLGGNGRFKSEQSHLNQNSISITENDGGGLFQTYNKLWSRKIGSQNLELIRDRSFAPNIVESIRGPIFSEDGSIIVYSVEKWDRTQRSSESTKPQFTLKAVRVADGNVLWDKEYGLDSYQQPLYMIGKKYIVHIGGLGKSQIYITNLETKEELPFSNYNYLKSITADKAIFYSKDGNKFYLIERDLNTKTDTLIQTIDDVKNQLVLNSQIYIRKESIWYMISGDTYVSTTLKFNMPFLSRLFGTFSGFPSGWGPGEIPQELLDATY
jgi:hypothetical protein